MPKPMPVALDASGQAESSDEDAGLIGIPRYLSETYWWAYLHPRAIKVFERQWLVNLILWGNFARLRDLALDDLGPRVHGRTLQVACVYGDFTPKLRERLVPGARLDVVDVAAIQLRNLRHKLGPSDNVHAHRQNAEALSFADDSFDQVVVFFLLHEVPAEARTRALSEALRVVKPGGKLVFVDYHRPAPLHPHRYLMRPVLKILEPFALDLWNGEILDWVPRDRRPARVEKDTYFGGLYQKVVMYK
jgi:ubiquinone/menaquinone biosynthesis C-methylase UbiE